MKKRLMRSRKNNKLAGVCGGLADYFNVDVTIIRALWVLSAFIGGPSIGVYILCAIIIPKDSTGEYEGDSYSNETIDDSANEYDTYSDEYDSTNEYDAADEYDSIDEYDDYEKTDYSMYDEDESTTKKEINLAYIGLGLIGIGAFWLLK